MNSEKVKELKDYIQKSADLGQYYMLAGGKITMMEVVDYINELESENERLSKALVENLEAYKDGFNEGAGLKKGVDNKLKTENQILKDRIAEMEKEIANKNDTITDLLKKQEFYETEKLKQFAERLKEKAIAFTFGQKILPIQVIDETLKEFIGDIVF